MPTITITAVRQTVMRETKTIELDVTDDDLAEMRHATADAMKYWARQTAQMSAGQWTPKGAPEVRVEADWTVEPARADLEQ